MNVVFWLGVFMIALGVYWGLSPVFSKLGQFLMDAYEQFMEDAGRRKR